MAKNFWDMIYECILCRNPDEAELREQLSLRLVGWYVHNERDDDSPTSINIHTHGLEETFNHPDIQLVLPLDNVAYLKLLSKLVESIKSGMRFEQGLIYSIEKNIDITFVRAKEAGRDILRVVLPDEHGNLEKDAMHLPYELQYRL